MPPMERKPAWGSKPSFVPGANGAPSRVGDGGKRQPKDGMGANMGARKPHDGGAGQRRGKTDGYSEEVSSPYVLQINTSDTYFMPHVFD